MAAAAAAAARWGGPLLLAAQLWWCDTQPRCSPDGHGARAVTVTEQERTQSLSRSLCLSLLFSLFTPLVFCQSVLPSFPEH